MKKLICYIIAFFPLLASAQLSTFTIKGKLGKTDAPAKAYLLYTLNGVPTADSCAVTLGNFLFSGQVGYPIGASIVVDYNGGGFNKFMQMNFPNGQPSPAVDILSFYLEKGEIGITATDSIKKANISGSVLNDDNKKLTAQLNVVNDKAKKIRQTAVETADQKKQQVKQGDMMTQLKALQDEQSQVLRTFVSTHPNSYISLLALNSLGGPDGNAQQLEPLYNNLSADLKQTPAGLAVSHSIQELKATAIGAIAPDFTQNDANGIPIKLSSFRGKYVLIDFWASWCGPCRQENPNVVIAYNKYKTKKFTILGVSLDNDDTKSAWMSAVGTDRLTWTQVSDLKGWNNAAAALYFVHSIPQNYLIDPTGKIIAKNLRGEDLENKLAEIFGKI